MSRALIFTYNIRRSLFEQNLDHYAAHLKRYNFQSNIYFLPIVNNLGDGIETRAKSITKILPRLLQNHKINNCTLVSFSLSGIDARFAIRHLGLSKYVNALTTIGTPHRGSRLAWMSQRQVMSDKRCEPISRMLGVGLRPFWQVTPQNMKNFNKTVNDVDSVRYFSIGGQRLPNNMTHELRETGNHMRLRSQPNFVYQNDGIFGYNECQWGNHLVNFQADHSELIGINNFPDYQLIISLIQDNLLATESASQ